MLYLIKWHIHLSTDFIKSFSFFAKLSWKKVITNDSLKQTVVVSIKLLRNFHFLKPKIKLCNTFELRHLSFFSKSGRFNPSDALVSSDMNLLHVTYIGLPLGDLSVLPALNVLCYSSLQTLHRVFLKSSYPNEETFKSVSSRNIDSSSPASKFSKFIFPSPFESNWLKT